MHKNVSRSALAIVITSSFLLVACNEQKNVDSISQQPMQFKVQPSVVRINSLDDLNLLFEKLNYGVEMWTTEGYEIPQISFKSLGETWFNNADSLPVDTKKSIFFRLMTPLILSSNENVLRERLVVKNALLTSKKLNKIAQKYRVIDGDETVLTDDLRQELLQRVDILPVSLALVQAAEESGWGTSRFAYEGNAFFGQWDFSGNAMKPKYQRKELGNYGVARFNTPLDSVEAYMRNLNTNPAYISLRELRTELRSKAQPISGYKLATTLTKYSERGEAYTQGLQQMIRFNNLNATDDMVLDKDNFVYLISGKNNVNKLVIFDDW